MRQPMSRKIIYVITRMVVGGAQETAKYTAEHFHHRGDDVLFVNGPETGREGHLLLDPRVPQIMVKTMVRRISPLNDLRAFWQLYRLFRAKKPDIVHARTSKARILAPFAARLARVPVVVQTIHGFSFGNEIDRKKWLYVLLERMVARMYGCNIVVSEADREEGKQLRILRDDRTALIRSGVNLQKVRDVDHADVARLRSQFSPDGETVVTLVGRLSMPKTPDVFVEAAAIVLRDLPDVRFVVVGDGAKREEIERLIAARGISNKVLMLGLRTDAAAIMRASDIVVHSSLREGLPKIVLEGMAAGKAVIGTNVGGVPVVIENGVTGLIVEPQDPVGLAGAITRLVRDPALREELVRNATARLDAYSLDRSFADTDALYERLLAAARQ
jgi:glycosyltransferase involved in cell wall biosynthesis